MSAPVLLGTAGGLALVANLNVEVVMPAQFSLTVQLQGGGTVEMPVTVLTSVPITISDLPVDVQFTVTNPLDRAVTITNVTVTTDDGLGLIDVQPVQTAMTFAANESLSNSLVCTPNSPIPEGTTYNVTATGVEG